MTLPPAPTTKKTASILTAALVFFLVLHYFVNNFFSPGTVPDASTTFPESFGDVSLLKQSIVSIVSLWLFVSGLVIIGVYKYFGNRAHNLEKPNIPFLAYYCTFIIWLILFLGIDFLTVLIAISLRTEFSESSVIIISIMLTTLTNLAALFLMFHYLSNEPSFKTWLSTLVCAPNLKTKIRTHISFGILAYIAFTPLYFLSVLFNGIVLKLSGKDFAPQTIVSFSTQNENIIITIVLFISLAVFAPIFEEIIMRGLIFRGLLTRYSSSAAALLSGAVFGLFHFNVFAFFPIAVLGTLLAWLYHKTGSLIPSMVTHALFNAINFSLLQFL